MKELTPGRRPPWRIAHRGDSAAHPENTVAAFDAALEAPIEGIELDVQISRDGVPVVYHDRTLRKAGRARERIGDLDLDALRSLDAGAWFGASFRGERIPTLDEVLDGYGRRTRLLVEIKDRGPGPEALARLVVRAADAILERRLERRTLLLCFDAGLLAAARKRSARLRTVLNLDRLPSRTAAWWRGVEPLFALSVNVRAIDRPFVERAHARGKPVLAYTCNTPRELRRALDAGVDGVMTDRPGWLARQLACGADGGRR